MQGSQLATTDDPPIRKYLGLPTLTALVVANMIGAGVFTSSGFSMAALNHPGRVMLTWVLCAGWAIAGSIAYGALAKRMPLSGGEYLFLSRLVHPALGFMAGWISLVAGFTVPIVIAAKGAATYSLPESQESDWLFRGVAITIIFLATTCHVVRAEVGAWVQNTIVGLKIALLTAFVLWAFVWLPADQWLGMPSDQEGPWWPENWNAWVTVLGAMSWIALSYTGFNAAVYVADESQHAERNVPRAMLVGTIIVTVIYLLLNYIFVYAPNADAILGKKEVAAIAAEAVGGNTLATWMRITIVLAMTSSVFSLLLAGPRVYQKMADDGVMPRILSSTGRWPQLATLVQALLAIIVLHMASLFQLMSYLGLTLSACGALAVLSLWWIQRRVPDAQPLSILELVAVIVYLAVTACILAASYTTHADEFRAMCVTFGIGIVFYVAWRQIEKS
ncbi:MAG: APC family permease [Planctomycetales bacterium]|nr:APC family permease [Planctomycetales bacterium]